MVKFNNDTMVEPIETEWFGFYKPGQSSEVVTLQESDLYIKVSRTFWSACVMILCL